jgi:hypothetical protein
MAVPTTRSALQTRALALRVEAAELAQGATILSGGSDGSTTDQKRHCSGLAHRLAQVDKELKHAGVTDTIYGVA